ncbi:hypothetical protein CEXT_122791 [Caerostris extrusa]|uniref:Uncharacterized protein n=1 Tax=Caerostris extrusa TaxID=172846 RepID=A0AAV4V131_CAEEX|nr:hypothetical protein CEXT_122791 [Caerostris extrusa]
MSSKRCKGGVRGVLELGVQGGLKRLKQTGKRGARDLASDPEIQFPSNTLPRKAILNEIYQLHFLSVGFNLMFTPPTTLTSALCTIKRTKGKRGGDPRGGAGSLS